MQITKYTLFLYIFYLFDWLSVADLRDWPSLPVPAPILGKKIAAGGKVAGQATPTLSSKSRSATDYYNVCCI